MGGATEARVKYADAPTYEILTFGRESISFHKRLSEILDQKIDIGIVELGCHKESNTFKDTSIDQVTVNKYTPGSLHHTDALTTSLRIYLDRCLRDVHFSKQVLNLSGSRVNLQ